MTGKQEQTSTVELGRIDPDKLYEMCLNAAVNQPSKGFPDLDSIVSNVVRTDKTCDQVVTFANVLYEKVCLSVINNVQSG